MKERSMNRKMRTYIFCTLIGAVTQLGFAQEEDKEQLKLQRETEQLIAEGNQLTFDDNFVEAETNYRKAIAINPKEEIGKYNLGNAYYNKAKNDEAMLRFQQSASMAQNKPEKHKAFHNLGNTFMNAKKYQEAVEAYKNALRNNPTDEETRYNLALAKEMLEKNPPQGGDGEDDNQDQKEQEDQKENQDNSDKNKEGDNKDNQENKDEGDKKDENNQGDEEGENEKPQEPKKDQEGEGDQQKQPQQPTPGQMSPQQIKNLLEAMNNEEKKVQDKMNVQKLKGAKVKSNKDW